MPSPGSPLLQRFHGLESSSPRFYDQLTDILYGEEYMRHVSDLQDDDIRWLVDYLDEARSMSHHHSPLSA